MTGRMSPSLSWIEDLGEERPLIGLEGHVIERLLAAHRRFALDRQIRVGRPLQGRRHPYILLKVIWSGHRRIACRKQGTRQFTTLSRRHECAFLDKLLGIVGTDQELREGRPCKHVR